MAMRTASHIGLGLLVASFALQQRSRHLIVCSLWQCRRCHSTQRQFSGGAARDVRVPRILFFGGDTVSVTALEALHNRLKSIARPLLQATPRQHGREVDGGEEMRVAEYVRDHLAVVCPSLPPGTTPEQAAARYSRQYPVARYAVENGLIVAPVDNPKSLAKSQLLAEMLSGSDQHQRSNVLQCPASEDNAVSRRTWSAAGGRPLREYDLAVVVSFRYFIPKKLLRALPPTINLHPSLLPKYRGASPIFSTLMRNEPVGGVSIIQLRADQSLMDSGSVVWQCEVPIAPHVDIRTYFPLVTQVGAAGLCNVIFGEDPETTGRQRASEGGRYMFCRKSPEVERDPVVEGLNQCRSPIILPEVISAAMHSHTRYLRLCEQSEQPLRRIDDVWAAPPAKGAKVAPPFPTPKKSSEVFADSVLSAYCDWPDTFWFNWRTAPAQQYELYPHFSADPFHAPLLPRDAAVLRFSSHSDRQAHGVWRAFVGGLYFHPAVNATLDKGCSPVRNQLLCRTLRRLVREGQNHDAQKHQQKHRKKGSQRDARLDAAVITSAMMREAERDLRLSCTFTKAVPPELAPKNLMDELRAVEEGVGTRFYRPPPPARGHEEVMTLSSLSEWAGEEEAPADYVPDVILVATPPAASQPELQGHDNDALPSWTAAAAAASQWYIPPGTAYFPRTAEHIGAIKCHNGWFLWSEAHLKFSTRPQPVQLLRKGLAMKTGMLYAGLFSEYCK